MNAFVKLSIACGVAVVGWLAVPAVAEAQYPVVVRYPAVVAPAPVVTYYAPAVAPAPVVTYRPVAPVTTFYAPAAPVAVAPTVVAPTVMAPAVVAPAVVYRPNPVLRPFRWKAATVAPYYVPVVGY